MHAKSLDNFASIRCSLVVAVAVLPLMTMAVGCQNLQRPVGVPVQANVVGGVVDQVNRVQEDNAEAAKFIVYAHEFEINQATDPDEFNQKRGIAGEFSYQNENRVRGFRLSPSGQDHLNQIAFYLQNYSGVSQPPSVIVERSETSRQWESNHRYPVRRNDLLDEARRRLVVNALYQLGIPNAEQIVVVAPAFPEGLNSQEAAQAWNRSFGGFGGQNAGGGFQ